MTDNESKLILIDKPQGITSFGVVAKVRKNLSNYFGHKIKVGHCGTLDPFATGLLLIVTGKECKNAGNYSKLDKTYTANICLGSNSSTGDIEGEINFVSDYIPTENEIVLALKKFTGDISQVPPRYSAIKINGKRAYKLAREGQDFEMPERRVKVYSIELVKYDYPTLSIRTRVSSGTYIRTLAEDIGKELTTGGYCKDLRRISIGEWSVDKSIKLDDL